MVSLAEPLKADPLLSSSAVAATTQRAPNVQQLHAEFCGLPASGMMRVGACYFFIAENWASTFINLSLSRNYWINLCIV